MIITGFRRVAYLAAAVCIFVALAPVQAAENLDAVLVRYELTLAKVKAWEQATVAAATALKGRENESETDDDDDDDGEGASTIEDIAAQMDSIPEYRRAIHKAGLSTREFVTIGLVLFQSMATDQVLQLDPRGQLPENMNPANLKFVRAHKTELEASVKAVQAVSSNR